MQKQQTNQFTTAGGMRVYRASVGVDARSEREKLIQDLDSTKGVLLSSAYESPGRYTRWDIGFTAPPLQLVASGRRVSCRALNARGMVLLKILRRVFADGEDFTGLQCSADCLSFSVRPPEPLLFEELRSRRRSVFTALRRIVDLFASDADEFLGLYGAFGYELAFQFEPVQLHIPRQEAERDLVLYLPDNILVIDHQREAAQRHYFDFEFEIDHETCSTHGLPRITRSEPYEAARGPAGVLCDHAPGEYAGVVRKALQAFRRGDLFEAVPGQTFSTVCRDSPGTVFRRLQEQNPAPYGALLNLGEQEYLVSASPEMYVRVRGKEVETCPISGTIARGEDPLQDAAQVRALLNSAKDEAELSMCTDVDRNDKSRVCVPGSVQVVGRRLIEMYSRLIHTVDHVQGKLLPEMDALDAFLAHAWAVTVTGAPKQAAIQFIEQHERSPRRWYGGAMGCLNFNGSLNSGLTLRTIRIAGGMAEIRAGATLLIDSDPEAEEAETRLKASALLHAVRGTAPRAIQSAARRAGPLHENMQVVMVDHRDSFVHTLASYLRESGAAVATVRPENLERALDRLQPALVVLSPGPGSPAQSGLNETIGKVLARELPLFGVCLGLQGIVEYFGGTLKQLASPMHGKPSLLQTRHGLLFEELPEALSVGRYHSLAADVVPACLQVCARSEDGVVMAVEHKALPVWAVQFHPESILSAAGGAGQRLLANVLSMAAACGQPERESLNG